jgi:heterodisulfide reductase subunit A
MSDQGKKEPVGAVMVVGGGIAGIQAALDLANSGYYVYLVERSPAIGGTMPQLDKTFPTNDCSMCILSPKLVECGQHLNIRLITCAEVDGIHGEEGNLKVRVIKRPRYVDEDKCVGCGVCASKCPKEVKNEFNSGLDKRKAIYVPYPQAVPMKYTIDRQNCIYFRSLEAGKQGRCMACLKYCENKAIDFDQKEEVLELAVGSVILSPGFEPFDPSEFDTYGYGTLPNVVTSVALERMLSASGPFRGHLVRPSDRREPKRIAWLQCVGSRDMNRCRNGYCSSVCCMYAIKEAVIAKEHSKGELDTAIFYMDMRTYGKEFEKYYQRAEQEKGVRFVRSRVHSVERVPGTDDLSIRYATEAGEVVRETFDLVVLSVGMRMAESTVNLAKRLDVHLDGYQFAETSSFAPARTSRSGVYVCGAFREPKDIPGSVMEASAAACAASQALAGVRHTKTLSKMLPHETHVLRQETRVGVFVCNCGINIGGIADVPAVTAYAATLPRVVHAEENLFTCSQDTQERIRRVIHEKGINRVVVASCSPRTHEPLFRSTIREAGLNPFLIEMANIRDQNTWVHQSQPEEATVKAKDLVRMAVAKVALTKPLYPKHVPVTKSALVVGGGVAGMVSALSLAEQGFSACLVEKSDSLGGQARNLSKTWKGESVVAYLEGLIDAVTRHPNVEVFLNTEVRSTSGTAGNFTTTLVSKGPVLHSSKLTHGVAILATGGRPLSTSEYLYGQNPNVLCWFDLDRLMAAAPERVKNARAAVFIQCVGSRDSVRPYCSKICCTHAVTSALQLKEMNPEMDVFILYRDIRTYGTREDMYREARRKGVLFVRYGLENKPLVEEVDGELRVTVTDHVLGRPLVIRPDFITLMTAIIPSGHEELAKAFKVPTNAEGFFFEAHMKLRPVDFATEGLFVCGLAHYPKPIDETIAQAQAVAARAMTILSKDETIAGGMVAEVDQENCAACLTCVRTCPYHVPFINRHGVSEIDAAKCQGCGCCASECPAGAITMHHFTDEEIAAKVGALFK